MAELDRPVSFRAGTGESVAALVDVLDVQAAWPGVRRLRAWGREVLGPGPGERAVDVGAGTGEETQAMAAAVGPSGTAIGVEPNPGLREVAAGRAAAAGSAARFVDGLAYALPFDDASVDVLRCERVFQHLDEPDRAAAEIARVLRPGGRALVADTDWATMIIHPGAPDTVETIRRFWLGRFPNPLSGRRLGGQLTAAGLAVADAGSQAIIQDATAAEDMLTLLGTVDGLLTAEAREDLFADLRAAARRGDFHFSVTMFALLAHKPGET
ncbi:methyltransferase domain-containing protein [Actinophytocola sp.]|uniref:methyltransferase domain-containing protein n=1 Tax=Actinophytocola sp. TaxID=1872138 RepID=UPI002D7FE6E8|nr:methyltransferase domain-containing protein [Actinophytocola sp.]HET9138307.1 methyltransferase domain-containing protein [Actinophytocola sp.]